LDLSGLSREPEPVFYKSYYKPIIFIMKSYGIRKYRKK